MGTLFALPWYLTWFGHSLNSYRNVVRLYDYFLASPHLLPLYVTAAIVLYREDEIFKEDCDMASLHCLLSHVCTVGTAKQTELAKILTKCAFVFVPTVTRRPSI